MSSHIRLLAEDDPSLRRRFRGLKTEDRGSIALHGATNFFPLPAERNNSGDNFLPLTEADKHRRERLVNNALQQRALENMSDIPVRKLPSESTHCNLLMLVFFNPLRNRSNISSMCIGAGFNLSSTLCTDQLSLVRNPLVLVLLSTPPSEKNPGNLHISR